MKKSLLPLTMVLTLAAAASGMAGAFSFTTLSSGSTLTGGSTTPPPPGTITPMNDCPRCL